MTEYVNKFGQVLNTGDKVIVLTQGYNHSLKERVGTFVGVHKNGGVQVEVELSRWTWVDKLTGEKTIYSSGNAEYKQISYTKLTTLQLNRVYKL